MRDIFPPKILHSTFRSFFPVKIFIALFHRNFAASSIYILIYLSVCLSVGFCTLLLVLYDCLSAKPWHRKDFALSTLQNNEPVPQVIETGWKPVLLNMLRCSQLFIYLQKYLSIILWQLNNYWPFEYHKCLVFRSTPWFRAVVAECSKKYADRW